VAVSPAIIYSIVPDKLVLMVSYGHNFGYNFSGRSGEAVTKVGGINDVSVNLSTNFFSEAMAHAFD
jgi:hypothetical protein